MPTSLNRASVIAILKHPNYGGKPWNGAGFVVRGLHHPHLILTCAHVVLVGNGAYRLGQHVAFCLETQPHETCWARVLYEDATTDVAVLEPETALPDVPTLPVYASHASAQHAFATFGYPETAQPS